MPADSRVDLPRLYECMHDDATLCAAKVRAYVYMTLLAICERGVSPHPALPPSARPVTFEFAEATLALCDQMLSTTATLDRTSAVQSARALLGMGCEAPDDSQLDPVLQTYFDRQLSEVTTQCDRLREVVAALMTLPSPGTPLS